MRMERLDGQMLDVPPDVRDAGDAAIEAWYEAAHAAAGLADAFAENRRRADLYRAWVAEGVPEAERQKRLAAFGPLPPAAPAAPPADTAGEG